MYSLVNMATQIVKTAGRQFRLYSETGTVLGTFASQREARKRQVERDAYLKAEKKSKNGNKTISK